MKKTIQYIVAFAALMLCGGAWASAVDTIAYWNQETFVEGANNGYALSAKGCNVIGNQATITQNASGASSGVEIEIPSGVSGNLLIFVKYSGLSIPDGDKPATLGSVVWSGAETDLFATSTTVNGAYGVTASGTGTRQTAATYTMPSEGMFAIYLIGSSGQVGNHVRTEKGTYFAVATKDENGHYSNFDVKGKFTSIVYTDRAFTKIKIGGSINNSTSYANPGMTIEGIAVSQQILGYDPNGLIYTFPNDCVSVDSGSSDIPNGNNAAAVVLVNPNITLDMVKNGYVSAHMSNTSSTYTDSAMATYCFNNGSESTTYTTQFQINESDHRKAAVVQLAKSNDGITAKQTAAKYGGTAIGSDATSWGSNGSYRARNLVIDIPYTHIAHVDEDGAVTWKKGGSAPVDWSTAIVRVYGNGTAEFDTTTAPAWIVAEEGATVKFTALTSAPFATGDGEVQIMASNVTSGFTVPAGRKITLVGGTSDATKTTVSNNITVNGTLVLDGWFNFSTAGKLLPAATGAIEFRNGEIAWNVGNANNVCNFKGAITVWEDAKLTLTNTSAKDIVSTTSLNVYGELCLNDRFSIATTDLYFYAGSKLTGTGDQYGALDMAGTSATVHFKKNPRHPELTNVEVNMPWRLRKWSSYTKNTADVDEGVIVEVKGQLGYGNTNSNSGGALNKTGLGTLKITGPESNPHLFGDLVVEQGRVIVAANPFLSTATSGITVKSGAYFGMSTDSTPLARNITVEEGGIVTFPANWAADTAYTLTTGTLTATDATNVKTYVGDAAKIVNLDYEGATVKYTIVRDAGTIYYYWHNPLSFKLEDDTETSLIEGDEVIVDNSHHSNVWSCELPEVLAGHKVYLNSSLNAKGVGIPANTEVVIKTGVSVYAGPFGANAKISGEGTIYCGYDNLSGLMTIADGVVVSCGFAVSENKSVIVNGALRLDGAVNNSGTIKIDANGQIKVAATKNLGTITSNVSGMWVRRTVNGDTATYDVVAPVVKTVIDGTTTYYATLQEALTAIGSGDITNVIILDDSIDTEPYGVEDGHLVAPVAQIDETQYSTFAKAFAAAQEAGATAENPTEVTALRSISNAVEIPEYAVVFATFANRITGALSGSGTYKIINTPSMTTSDSWDKTIGNWFGAGSLTSFNGTLWMARGRFQITESIESGRVALKVTDGAQLYVTSGTISNPIEISGNGMTFESNDTKYQAVRLDGATYSGKITAVVTGDEENKIVPRIGTHNNAGAIITGDIIAPDGIKLQSTLAAGVITISTIKGSVTDTSVACAVEKVGAGEVKVKNIGKGDIKITSGTFRLNEAKVAANVNFEIASGAKLNCYGWPTFAGAWSIKTDATIDGVLDNTGNNPACIRTGTFTKKGTGTITMPLLFGNGAGANNYKGSITVEGGELIIGKNSTFDSTATITVEDGATLSVADGITISGNAAISVADEGTIKGYGTSTLSGALTVENGSKIEVGADATLTINGSFTSESEVTIEKIGNGKLILGADTTATNVSIKLSAGTIAMPSSLEIVPEMADGKTGFVTTVDGVTTYIPFTTPTLSNPTTVWGSDSNTSYLSKDAAAPTPIFVSQTSLADIANGNAKLVGKMKGSWVGTMRDLAIARRDNYSYVEGSNTYEIQCQMYDGSASDLHDYYTKVQNVTLYQIEDNGVYYIFANGSQGYYLNDGTDSRGTYIAQNATGVQTPSSGDGYQTAYEAIKLEIDQTNEGSYNGKNYASIIAAIAAAQADPGHGSVTLQADTASSVVVPSGVVLELNNHQISGQVRVSYGGWITENNVVKIDGFTTSFDIVYNDKYSFDYQQEPKATSNIGAGEASYFSGDDHNDDHGIYLKHQPYIGSIPESFFTSTDQLTMAVVGTMPAAENTIFAHMGSGANNYNGIFLASGGKANEVVVAYNNGSTATVIANMTVPNAATARHLYIITKKDTETKASFTVYLDGDEFTTQTFDKFIIKGGYQLGRTFNTQVSGFSGVADTDSSSYVNVFRAYDRVISSAEIERYKEVYQYTSIDGNYERTFATGDVDWSATDAWERTDVTPHTQVTCPTAGMVSATFAGDTTVTVNSTEENLYEKLTIAGTGTITFNRGEGEDIVKLTPIATQIMTPIIIEEDSLDLAGGPTKVGEHGSVTFDFTSLTAKAVANDGGLMLKVTGITDAGVDMTKFVVRKNEAETRLNVRTIRNADDGCIYVEATVAPIDIYYVENYFNAGSSGDHPTLKLADETVFSYDAVLACDTVVVRDTTDGQVGCGNEALYFAPTGFKNIKVECDIIFKSGSADASLGGSTITIADGKTLTFQIADYDINLGEVTINKASAEGTGVVVFASSVSATAIAGDATLKLAEGATLTVGTALTAGRVTSNVDTKKVKIAAGTGADAGKMIYSLIVPVASITVDEETTYFATIAEAIAAAGDDNLSSITVIDQNAEIPGDYKLVDGVIVKKVYVAQVYFPATESEEEYLEKFESFEEAFCYASGIVSLLADVELEDTFVTSISANGQTYAFSGVIDLNGHELTVAEEDAAVLSVVEGASVQIEGTNGGSIGKIDNYGTLYVGGGSIEKIITYPVVANANADNMSYVQILDSYNGDNVPVNVDWDPNKLNPNVVVNKTNQHLALTKTQYPVIDGVMYSASVKGYAMVDGVHGVYVVEGITKMVPFTASGENATITPRAGLMTVGGVKYASVGTEVRFTVEEADGYCITAVTLNGAAIEPVEGVYSYTPVADDTEVAITVETAVGSAFTFETGSGTGSNASYMDGGTTFALCVAPTEDAPAGSVIHVKSLVLGRAETANPEKLPDYIRIGDDTYSAIVNGTGDPSTAAQFSDNSYKQTYTFENLDIVVGTSYPLLFTSDTNGTVPHEVRWHLHNNATGPIVAVNPTSTYTIVAQLNGIIEKAPLAVPTLEWGSNDNRETYLAINDEPSTYVFAGVTLADIISGKYELSTWMAGALDRGNPWLKIPCNGTIFWTDIDTSDKTVVFQSQCRNGTLDFSLVQKVQLTEVEFGGNTYITARDLGQFYVSGANAYKSLIEGPGTTSDVNNHYIECVRLTLTPYLIDGTALEAESLLQPEGGLRIAPNATVTIDGAGAVITPNMELSDGAKLVVDPVRTPILVNTKVAFGADAKLSLASDYASVTCGKMTLFTYPTACTITESAITEAIVDSTSFNNASYTVAVENSPKSGYKRVVLTIGDYASVPETTFLPLGDSITEGYTDGISATGVPNYRVPLMEMLAAHGYKPVTRGYRTTNNQNAINMTADAAYQNHCGMVGHRILTGYGHGNYPSYSQFAGGYLQGIENYLAQAGEVDYITLLIGTNDIERSPNGAGSDAARQSSCEAIFANWKTLIKRVVKQNPTSRVILTTLPANSGDKETLTQLLNSKIQAYIGSDESVADGIPSEQVTLIDLHTACAGQFITASPLHPNWNGHIKNAAAWFAGIKAAEAKAFVKDETKLQTKTGIENTIPAAYTKGYVKLAEVDVKNIAKLSSVEANVAKIASKEGKTLTRVGYYVESQFANQTQTAYLWVDMPLWGEGTKTLADVSVPTTETGLVRDVVDGIHVYSAGAGVENVEPTDDTVKGIIVRTIKGLNGAAGTVLTAKGEPTPSASVYDWNDSANANANWGAWQVFRINTPDTGFTSASTLFTFGGYNTANASDGNDFGIGDLSKHSETTTMSWITTGSNYSGKLSAGSRKAAKIEIWGKIEGAVIPEANEAVIVEAATEEEALAQTDIVIADEAAEAAGQTVDILKKVATDNGDGTWSIKVELNAEATIPNTEKTVQAAVEETAVSFAQQGLEAVAGATEETQVSIPAAKVVPGLYYSVSYGTTPDNHTDESDRVLATGSEGVTIPVPALGSEKVYYIKIKASATR